MNRTSILALLALPAAYVGGFNFAQAQSDEQPASPVVLAEESSFEIRAGSVTRRTGDSMELTEGVVVTFESSEMTLSANSMTIRENEPWEIVGFSLTHPVGTITAESGTFDPKTQAFTTEGNATLTRAQEVL